LSERIPLAPFKKGGLAQDKFKAHDSKVAMHYSPLKRGISAG